MTRGNLRARVKLYVDRSDLDTPINNWIDDTRLDLALKYNFHYLYTEACATTVANSATYSLPSDFLGHETVWCENKKLARLTPREFDELTWTDHAATAGPRELTTEAGNTVSQTSVSGYPDYYVHRGMNLELWPPPAGAYTLRIKYYAQPTAFSNDDEYDYITTFHPEAVIWGAALRGSLFLDDEAKTTKFEAAYGTQIQEMIKREKEFSHGDQHPRMKTWKDFDGTTLKRLLKVA